MKRFVPKPRSNFRSRSFRPLGTMAKAQRITRVQRCNFFVATTITPSIGPGRPSVNAAIELCKIVDHIFDNTAGGGVAAQSIVKSVDISRIVFDYGFNRGFSVLDGTDDSVVNDTCWVHAMLAVDRLSAGGVPQAVVNVEPFMTQSPMVAISAGVNPPLNLGELDWPTRVLWRRHDYYNPGFVRISLPQEDNVYGLAQTAVGPTRGSVNKRLKLRLDDEHGLYLVGSIAQENDSATIPAGVQFWCGGCFYYRVNI